MGLFNTTHIHKGKTEYVPYCEKIEVTEKRAPTDESVRLLSEFQEKAEKNIINSIIIKDNVLNAVALFMQADYVENRVRYGIRFSLNGEQFNLEGFIDKGDYENERMCQSIYNNTIRTFLVNEYAKRIAEAIEPLINPI